MLEQLHARVHGQPDEAVLVISAQLHRLHLVRQNHDHDQIDAKEHRPEHARQQIPKSYKFTFIGNSWTGYYSPFKA